MAFVSRNPKTVLNPETAENCIGIEPKNLQAGQEFIGYYKNQYVDPVYNNKCYVFKGKDDGRDYLFYGTKSLHDELSYYSQGDLVSIIYKGQHENKKGPFAGKMSHIWKVTGEDSWIPSEEFVNQLRQEVQIRRQQVQQILSSGMPIAYQQKPQGFAPMAVAPISQGFGQSSSGFGQPVRKNTDPFG